VQESVGSLRAFFIIVGLWNSFWNGLGMLGSLVVLALNPILGGILALVTGVGLVMGLAYLYCGISLPSLLQNNPGLVITVIMANLGLIGLGIVLSIVGGTFGLQTMISSGIGLAISFYLLNSVKRLAGR
jgi:hypothetical protein